MTPSPWTEAIATIQARLSNRQGPQVTGQVDAVEIAAAAAVGARALFEKSSRRSPETVSFGCVSAAADVLRAAAAVRGRQLRRADQGDVALVARLEQALADHDSLVWAGEAADALGADETSKPAARLLSALGSLRTPGTDRDRAIERVETNAFVLAVALVRAGFNAKLTGDPRWDPGPPQPALSASLLAIEDELDQSASALEMAAERASVNVVTTNLEAARREPFPHPALEILTSPAADPRGLVEALAVARLAWIRVAAYELIVVRALDRDLPGPERGRFGRLEHAIAAGTANVLYWSRLGREPQRFRHDDAWARQLQALDDAADTFRRGLHGDTDAFDDAQQILITRVLRAATAVAVIDRRLDTGPGA